MTLGRFATFAAILAASIAVAGVLVRRHQRALAARQAVAALPSVREPPPPSPHPAATGPILVSPGKSDSPPAASAGVVEDPLTDALCPSGMLLVDGTTCASRRRRCAERDAGGCKRYDATECRKGQTLRFCVDRYEYPNLEGVVPATMVTFEQARSACEEEDKRLCNETEWQFACEGRDGSAFPYGNERDADACNVARTSETVRAEQLWEPRDVSAVVARVDRRVPSGSLARCASAFGVRDLVGNLEEWATGASGIESALLGGDAIAAEPSCGLVRKTRQTAFRTPHAGFRCCRDPLVRAPPRPSAAPERP